MSINYWNQLFSEEKKIQINFQFEYNTSFDFHADSDCCLD